jgi:hypothetical protein
MAQPKTSVALDVHVSGTVAAFHDRLLELIPIYTTVGQRIARITPIDVPDDMLAWKLADRACRTWLRRTIAPNSEIFDAIVFGLETLDP